MSEFARWLSHKGETPTQFMNRTKLSWATVQRAIHQRRCSFVVKTALKLHIGTYCEVPASEFSAEAAELLAELDNVRRRRRRSA